MIVYLRGEDSFLAQTAISALKKKYLEKNPDGVELIEIGADEPLQNWADLKASPLFATSRLIVIKRAGELLVDEQNNLASMLTDLPPSSVVVIWDAKPFKAKSPLWVKTHKEAKIIPVEPLIGTPLKNWISKQAATLGLSITPGVISELVKQFGSDLWAIQTDLQSRHGANSSPSNWAKQTEEKPFLLFDLVRGQRWDELKKHLRTSYERGEAIEMTLGGLAAAVRKNIRDQDLKKKITDTLSEVDIALKSGLIEAGDAVALLITYLPDGPSTKFGASQKRVQWEAVWESLA